MNTYNPENLNKKYNEDFNTALNIYLKTYPHESLISFLKDGTDVEKQIAVLKLETINSQEEADILMHNLTDCDGKIREAVSFKLKDFLPQKPQFYEKFTDKFLASVVDINGNICRNIIFSLKYLKNNPKFYPEFCNKLITLAITSAQKVKEFDIQEGKYKINKEIFKLYWYLETIFEFKNHINSEDMVKILTLTKDIGEYTIREKTAKILANYSDNSDLLKIKEELKNDPNYYVRRY